MPGYWSVSKNASTSGDYNYYNIHERIIYQREPKDSEIEELKQKLSELEEKMKSKPKEGIDMKGLFIVYMVYGEDRKNLIFEQSAVIANDQEDAKIKSGLLAKVQKDWDADYLTFIVQKIGDVKCKEKPKEVKQVQE